MGAVSFDYLEGKAGGKREENRKSRVIEKGRKREVAIENGEGGRDRRKEKERRQETNEREEEL